MTDIQNLISCSSLRLRRNEPFFATLMLFADIVIDNNVQTAATDGGKIYLNQDYASKLNDKEFDAVILHEVLHCALLHTSRIRERNHVLWNYAADIVVNGQIRKLQHLNLPEGVIVDESLEEFSTEEVYSILLSKGFDVESIVFNIDLLESDITPTAEEAARLKTHWSSAFHKATTLARMAGKTWGTSSLAFLREYTNVLDAQLDWRQYLWRFMVATPTDFTGFDRRFIGDGLYLDAQDGESVNAYICIDTSGSISEQALGKFMAEVTAIERLYPHIVIQLFYCDSDLYGPYKIQHEIPKPIGGGGTDFIPFFNYIEDNIHNPSTSLAIYLTDGYGRFPEEAPECNVLWIIVAGGKNSEEIPFGDTVRLF